jgi:cytochrome c
MNKYAVRILAVGLMLALLGSTALFAADAAAGKAVYDKKCKMCHGAAGEGNAGMAKALGTTITPLSSDEVQKMSDADLKKVITQGKGKMKPPAGLSDTDVNDVIAHVRTLKK